MGERLDRAARALGLSALGREVAVPERRATLENPQTPLSSEAILSVVGVQNQRSGVAVTPDSSLTMQAVWRAVNLISGTAASLPLHAYRDTDGYGTKMNSGQAHALLSKPHPDMTPFELWELGYGSLCTWGNAFYRKLRDGFGIVRELWWINPATVKVTRDPLSLEKRFVIDGDEDHPLTEREVFHVPGFSIDGISGISPIRMAREGIGLALAAEQYAGSLFGNGLMTGGILESDRSIQPEVASKIKANFEARNHGLANANGVAVLDNGLKYHQLTLPPEDAQFMEARGFQISEVARIFGVPPHLLMDTDKSTSWGTGIEQQTQGWVTFGLRSQYLTRFEQRMTMMLRPEQVYARYSLEGLLRGDSAARGAFYTQMFNLGVLSTNDIRALEELPPVEGGDTRYVPLNLGILGEKPEPVEAPAPPVDDDPQPVDEPVEENV